MQLSDVILGFLSWKPMTGYELKKLFSSADFLPWSGNNNQIYKTLVDLNQKGWVEKEIIHQESLPSQKRYTITDFGVTHLKDAISRTPESPDVKNMFILHLAWADYLNNEELTALLDEYQNEVEINLKMCREKLNLKDVYNSRTKREEFIWDMIWDNRVVFFENELNWLTRLRNGLANK